MADTTKAFLHADDETPHRRARHLGARSARRRDPRHVNRLARATAFADSAYIATTRALLLSEDYDLDGLRPHPCFKDFEAMYFPASVFTPTRPSEVHRLEDSRHTRGLLVATAQRWESTWHHRGRDLERHPDVHVMREWWSDECTAWELIREVAVHYRHWRTRMKLTLTLRDFAEKYDFDALDLPYPLYEDEPLPDAPGSNVNAAAKEALELSDSRLAELSNALPKATDDSAHALLRDTERWQSTLRTLDARAQQPKQFFPSRLCDHHAALWQQLGEWMSADSEAKTKAGAAAFKEQVQATGLLWRTAYDWWRPASILLAMPLRTANRDGVAPAKMLLWNVRDAVARDGRQPAEGATSPEAVPELVGLVGRPSPPAPLGACAAILDEAVLPERVQEDFRG